MPTATYTPIASTTLSSAQASVSFDLTSTQGYRDLILVINGTLSATTSSWLVLNSNTTSSNYSMVYMAGNGSSTFSGTDTVGAWLNYRNITSNSQAVWIANIMDYSATDKHKTVLVRSNSAGDVTEALCSRFASTSAITTVLARPNSGNWNSGTTFNLYGVIA